MTGLWVVSVWLFIGFPWRVVRLEALGRWLDNFLIPPPTSMQIGMLRCRPGSWEVGRLDQYVFDVDVFEDGPPTALPEAQPWTWCNPTIWYASSRCPWHGSGRLPKCLPGWNPGELATP